MTMMTKSLLFVFAAIVSLLSHSATPVDYKAERHAFAATKNYNPTSLQILYYSLIKEHRKLASDPNASFAQINAPLQKLANLYPLGIQVNLATASFLEYTAKMAQSPAADSGEIQQLLEIAKAKRKKAADILASILSSGDGVSHEKAFVVINILEEHAVLESRGLHVVSQSLVAKNNKYYDEIVVADKSGVKSKIYFDITLFYKAKKPN